MNHALHCMNGADLRFCLLTHSAREARGDFSIFYGGRESSTRWNFRKHMQIEKAPANQENIFIILTAYGTNAHKQIKKHAANAHNTTKYILFAARFFLVVLWAFAACALSNWRKCFLNLQVFSKVAARWALSATVIFHLNEDMNTWTTSPEMIWKSLHEHLTVSLE